MKLIHDIITGDIPHVETMTVKPELTSDQDNCRTNVSDRCGRPRTSALLADEGYLFFDHIYSTSFDTTPKRYLTSFAVTRDFFHSFFGTAPDDLDQQFSLQLPRDGYTEDREDSDRMLDDEDAQPPLPPPEAPRSNPISIVENTHNAVNTSAANTPAVINTSAVNTSAVLPRRRSSPEGLRRFNRRTRSTSPTTRSQQPERQRERSNSRDRERRLNFTTARGENSRVRDTIFPGAIQQPTLADSSAKSTQAAIVSSATPPRQKSKSPDRTPRRRSASPTAYTNRSEKRGERSPSYQRERQGRDLATRANNASLVGLESGASVPERPNFEPPPAPLFAWQETQGASRADTSPAGLGNTRGAVVSTLSTFQPPTAPMFEFQGIQGGTFSLLDVSRILFHTRGKTKPRPFKVFSPAEKNRYRVSEADYTDPLSMVNALRLQDGYIAVATGPGKKIKVKAAATIVDEGRKQKLDAALLVSRKDAGDVIRQLEDLEDSGDEFRHPVDPKPIQIHIWDEQVRSWKIEKKKFTSAQIEDRIKFLMSRARGVRPYDLDGNPVDVEECFDAAQRDNPPTIYLCRPEDVRSIPL